MILRAIILVLAIAPLAHAQDRPQFKPLPTPAGAVLHAAVDAARLPRLKVNDVEVCVDAPFTRYLWFAETDPKQLKADMQGCVLACNIAAQIGCGLPYRPVQCGERMLRVDLRGMAESLEGLQKLTTLWEEYRFDPAFSTLITANTKRLLKGDSPKVKRKVQVKTNWREVDSEPYTHNGQTYRKKWEWDAEWKEEWVSITDLGDAVIRLPGEHLDLGPYLELQSLLQTEAPVIDGRYFLYRSLASIKGSGTYKTIFGGLYYEHVGLQRSDKDGVTDEDLLLQRLGVINVAKGERTKDVFHRLKSDRRAAMFRSRVTGGPRIIEWYPHLAAPTELLPLIMVTGDVGNTEIDTERRPVFDLRNPIVKAREWLITRPNGEILYVLTDAVKGALQEKAPDDVVRDSTVPPPNSSELQSCISCLACHGSLDGWQPFRNEVLLIHQAQARILGEVKPKKIDVDFDTIARLEEQYQGNADNLLRMLKTVHAGAVLRITGPWASKDQTDVAVLGYASITRQWRAYAYTPIDAGVALRELGFDVPKEQAIDFLGRVLPPLDAGVQLGDLVPEDVRVWGLLAGLEIVRTDWALFYSFAALRSQATLAAWQVKTLGNVKVK